jgi:hypothetical protein
MNEIIGQCKNMKFAQLSQGIKAINLVTLKAQFLKSRQGTQGSEITNHVFFEIEVFDIGQSFQSREVGDSVIREGQPNQTLELAQVTDSVQLVTSQK